MNPSRRKLFALLSSIGMLHIFPGFFQPNVNASYFDQITQFGLICSRKLFEEYPSEYHRLHLFSKEDIRAQIENDFLKNQIVLIEGWILSLTEVKLFILLAISAHE
ncbi:MAG: hypothetical protein JKY01_11095 [Pseudomonadales bacterium]|nr:hypothetical protein [Pseudomonadales bacterium]